MNPPSWNPGPPVHHPAPYGGPPHARPAPGPPVAGFGRRLSARLIDYTLLGVLAFMFFVAVVIVMSLANPELDEELPDRFYEAWALLFFFGWGGLILLYDWLCHAGWGRTLGKLMVGIRVVDRVDGGPLSQGKALGRAALFGLPQSALCIGHVFTLLDCMFPLWDTPLKQSLHDKMCGTIVILVHG